MMENELLDERARDLLRWRSRRGLVENDIFVEQFFRTYGASLNVRQAQGLTTLMNLSDKCWRCCAAENHAHLLRTNSRRNQFYETSRQQSHAIV